MKTDCSLSSFFSFRLVSLVSSFAKEETREMRQKNTTAKDIFYLTIPVNLAVSKADERCSPLQCSRGPHLNRSSAFSLAEKGAKKKLGKKKRRKERFAVATARRRPPPPPRQAPLKRGLDSPNKKQKRRLNASVFEKARPKL